MTSDVDQVLAIEEDEPAIALSAAESARAAAERSGDRKARAIAMIKAANALSLLGKPQEAMAQAEQALDLCEDLRFDAGRGAALAVIARICAAHGAGEDDAELAFDSAQDALRLFRKQGLKRGEAIALWSTAKVEAAFGRPEQVLKCAREAMGIFQELGETSSEAVLCHTLADGYLAVGDTRRAASAVSKALAIQGALGNKKKEAACLHILATIEIQGNDSGKSAAALEKARSAFKAIGDYRGEAAVMGTERDMHLDAGSFMEAVRVAKETVTLFHNAGDKKGEGNALLKLAELLLSNGDIPRAAKVAEVAMGILVEAQDRDGMRQAMEMLGAIKHEHVKQEMQQVIEMNKDFMHVPKTLVVDPGFNKRIEEAYKEAAKKGLF